MARILIGFAEAVPAPEVFFSLHHGGYEVAAFTRGGAGSPTLRHLPLVAVHDIPAPEGDVIGAKAGLAAVAEGYDAVFALDDVALWLANAALDADVPMIHATGAQAAVALDKIAQIEAARAAGFAVPDTCVAHTPAEARASAMFPSIIKPALPIQEDGAQGLEKGGAMYALSAKDLADIPDQGHGLAFPALIQPLVAGTGEGVFGFATDQGVINWSGHARVRMMNPHGSGSSACRTRHPDAATRAAGEAMMMALGWRGPFMIELLRDADGTAWFMELNGRMWGSLALARRAGFEYPLWAVEAVLKGQMPPNVSRPETETVQRHLGRELLHLLFTLKGPKSAFHKPGWPKLWRSLIGVLAPAPLRRFYNYDPAFRTYFLRDAWAVVAGFLRSRR